MDAIGRLVRNGMPIGTGFVVTADGLAVTAQHVIASGGAADWTFEPLAGPGLSFAVDVSLAADEEADVALLQIAKTEDWKPMILASHQSTFRVPGPFARLRRVPGLRLRGWRVRRGER